MRVAVPEYGRWGCVLVGAKRKRAGEFEAGFGYVLEIVERLVRVKVLKIIFLYLDNNQTQLCVKYCL